MRGMCAVAAVLVAGLWLAARDGPSAQSARVPAPTPTATATGVEGPTHFGRGPYPTARPARVRAISTRTPAPPAAGWGLPRRRSAQPTPTAWELIVGAVRTGDATGLLPEATAGEGGEDRPTPTPAPVRTER